MNSSRRRRLVAKAPACVFLACAVLHASSLPNRIVSLSPNTTELLYGIGAFPRVVGVSQYCTYPNEVMKLPRIGGWEDSSIEKILALRPDLVVLTKPQEPFIGDALRNFHVRYVAVPSESLEDVYRAIQMIGGETGNEKDAAELSRHIRTSLDVIRSATRDLPKPSVLVSVGHTPGTLSDLYVATEGSYLVDLITFAGGRSVAPPDRLGYGKISKEAVMKLNPEVIIDLVPGVNAKHAEEAVADWSDLPELRAVREKRVYSITDPFAVHPSQFVTHTAELFEGILHPETTGR
ncbi:MAG: ABC transporter substrate-binding protein [Acidobacteriaceae bacterium]|nr:ABC transporter substrate-binding protein [Acidobacteriaceae bacterium]MBV8572493.1 ABC transporter substrate-binding protein [Acidobacteriaceae bacterium]